MEREIPEGHVARYRYEIVGHRLGPKAALICEIVDPDRRPVARGHAICGPHDAFDEQIGTTIARGRALAELDGTARRRKLNKRISGATWQTDPPTLIDLLRMIVVPDLMDGVDGIVVVEV
jgi:hypothetical protein